MDSNTLIIGLVITAIITIPILYIQVSQNSRQKKQQQIFINKATRKNLTLDDADFWGTYYAIGIDRANNKLLYSKNTATEVLWNSIDLEKIEELQICTVDRRLNNKTTNKKEIDCINLVLNIKNEKTISLEFYNIDVNIEMTTEKMLLEKWQQLIKSHTKKLKTAA